jgi:DUF971 family protein
VTVAGGDSAGGPRVELVGDDTVFVEWEDGHQSRYAGARLRALCPCAGCREDRAPKSPLAVISPTDPAAARILRIQGIGRYAVTPVFGDHHATGIFSWEYLRRHCECLACRMSRQGEET